MTGEIEGIGGAVEGVLASAAVENEFNAAGVKNSASVSGQCLNCGAGLTGPFCASCGQKAHVHRTISAIWHDILHGVLHFDGKLWRTLPMLTFKPGELTRRYIHGERAKFISPMALFLFSIFMMFAVFSFMGGPVNARFPDGGFTESVKKELAENQKLITAKEKKLLDGAVSRERLSGEQAELLELKKAQNGLASIVGDTLPYPAEGLDEGDGAFGFTGDGSFTTGIQWLDEKFKDGMKKADKNPTLLLYKLQSNGYKFAWLLIPLSLPFVWLVTIGAGGSLRPHRFYDHAVFTTYSIAFMSLLFLTCALLAQLGWESAWIAMGIIPPLHLYKHLRHSYALSRLSAVIRLCLMFVCIGIVATLFLLILLVLGVLG
jgi:hypothetical protein